MVDPIYLIDPTTQQPLRVTPVSFREINIKERADLERWVLAHPEILGESLLVITSEYDQFDKSSRRLDVLALDSNGVLVIVELKLDIAKSWADQQAIRYAAFCSNMTMDHVVQLLRHREKCSVEDATQRVTSFLDVEELPDLYEQPRIILAAGSIDDQELTSCVLWLRRFGVDITCIELTPYRLPTAADVILVPRIIIPLPETSSYQIAAEKKDVTQIQRSKEFSVVRQFFARIATEFNALETKSNGREIKTNPTTGSAKAFHKKVPIGNSDIHYEWTGRRMEDRLDVCLHFESDDREKNLRWLGLINQHEGAIGRGIELEYDAKPWGKRWAQIRFRVPFDGNLNNDQLVKQAAETMKLLIERIYPVVTTFD